MLKALTQQFDLRSRNLLRRSKIVGVQSRNKCCLWNVERKEIGLSTEKPVYPKARIPKSPYTEKPVYPKAVHKSSFRVNDPILTPFWGP
jgi:hypothetical protein